MELEAISGVCVQVLRSFDDERGSLLRLFDDSYTESVYELFRTSYVLLSRNPSLGTLRGLHYQAPPYGERKFVSCLAGAIFLVALDLRPESDSFLESGSITLSAGDRMGVYIPDGIALGWLTLVKRTDVHYTIDGEFRSVSASGVRFDDPILRVSWPSEPKVISSRDLSWPPFERSEQGSS